MNEGENRYPISVFLEHVRKCDVIRSPVKGERGQPACACSCGLYCPLVAASCHADADHRGRSWSCRSLLMG